MTSRLSFFSHTCCVKFHQVSNFAKQNCQRAPSLGDQAALRESLSLCNCSGSCVALRQLSVDIEVTNASWAQRDTLSGLLCRCQQAWLDAF